LAQGVVGQGRPGPWNEAAKGILYAKNIPFVRVRQEDAPSPNFALLKWTGQTSAPVLVYNDERPRTFSSSGRRPRQNTDPWVFGDSFRFSNCRQLTPERNRSALQSLTQVRSLLFGSTIGGVRHRHGLHGERFVPILAK
jgi:hypothetical protein